MTRKLLTSSLMVLFVLVFAIAEEKTDSAMIEFLAELRRIRDQAVPADELGKAKSYIALGLPSEFETTAAAAAQFADLIANGLPFDTYVHAIDHINAVTAADVQRVAKQHIDPDHFAIVVVGDRAKIEPGLKALNEGPISVRDLWGHEVTP